MSAEPMRAFDFLIMENPDIDQLITTLTIARDYFMNATVDADTTIIVHTDGPNMAGKWLAIGAIIPDQPELAEPVPPHRDDVPTIHAPNGAIVETVAGWVNIDPTPAPEPEPLTASAPDDPVDVHQEQVDALATFVTDLIPAEPTTAGDPMTVIRTPWITVGPTTTTFMPPKPVPAAEPPVLDDPVDVHQQQVDKLATFVTDLIPDPAPAVDDPTKHVCIDCPRSFATGQGLRTHRNMMHNPKERGHVCADCGRTYAKPSSLRTHRVRRHTEVPAWVETLIPCPWCPQMFGAEFARDIHVTAMHTAEQAKLQAAVDDHPSTQPVALEVVPAADVGATPTPVINGDRVVACTDCNFVTHAAESYLMQQHTFKVHKRIRNLTEKRPFTFGVDDGGDAA